MKKTEKDEFPLIKPRRFHSDNLENLKTNEFILKEKTDYHWSTNPKLEEFAQNRMAHLEEYPISENLEEQYKKFKERKIKINQELEKEEGDRNEELLLELNRENFTSFITFNNTFISEQQNSIIRNKIVNEKFLSGKLTFPSSKDVSLSIACELFTLLLLSIHTISNNNPFKLTYINKIITTFNWATILEERINSIDEKKCLTTDINKYRTTGYLPLMEKLQTFEEYKDTMTQPHEIVNFAVSLKEENLSSNTIDVTPINFEPPLLGNDTFHIESDHN